MKGAMKMATIEKGTKVQLTKTLIINDLGLLKSSTATVLGSYESAEGYLYTLCMDQSNLVINDIAASSFERI